MRSSIVSDLRESSFIANWRALCASMLRGGIFAGFMLTMVEVFDFMGTCKPA